MQSTGRCLVLSAGLVCGLPAAAGADVIQVSHTPAYLKNINVSAPSFFDGDPFTIVPTATFQWTRTDTPSEGSEVPMNFAGFCLQINEPVEAGVVQTYEVMTLDQAGYAGPVRDALARLWEKRDKVNSIDASAAFQMAVWEIVHDFSADLTSGDFIVNSLGNARDTAQQWLLEVATTETPDVLPEFRVLRADGIQDQLIVVPAPGAAAMAAGLAGIIGLRRRRR